MWWVPCDGDFVGAAFIQMVVPSSFRDMVLQTAYDSCGWGDKENL